MRHTEQMDTVVSAVENTGRGRTILYTNTDRERNTKPELHTCCMIHYTMYRKLKWFIITIKCIKIGMDNLYTDQVGTCFKVHAGTSEFCIAAE